MWPRVQGLRAMELGTPGEMRGELNALVLAGKKRGTAGLFAEYAEEDEQLETVGERMALLDSDNEPIGVLEITGVEIARFAEVTWEFADFEGEGFTSVEDWQAGHSRFWADEGTPVDDDTEIACISFRLVSALA